MDGTIWGDDALNTVEAAEYCGYAAQTFRCEYKAWGIPYQHVAGRPCFLKPALDAFLAKRGRKPYERAAA